MLLQTQQAGTITLLPAVPKGWGAGMSAGQENSAIGLRGRGDVTVDMVWDYPGEPGEGNACTARLLAAKVTFGSKHYFHSLSGDATRAIKITTNALAAAAAPKTRILPVGCMKQRAEDGAVVVLHYPCEVVVCGGGGGEDDTACRNTLSALNS
jgi:hypothetical protein